MRAAAPPPGGPRQPARRLAVPGPGARVRARLRWAPGGGGGGGGGPHVCGGRGSPRGVPGNLHLGPPPRAHAERSLRARGPSTWRLPARVRLRRAGR